MDRLIPVSMAEFQQLRDKVKSIQSDERDRCARIVEGWINTYGATNPEYVSAQAWATDAMRDILDAIRNPEPSN